mmetsp:Transcript_86138/g.240886  ORF Transcript_86138/g.240886 Transcript_86138/m.240886 type:complete len:205 (+) Transcript_86138:990-1604(+)
MPSLEELLSAAATALKLPSAAKSCSLRPRSPPNLGIANEGGLATILWRVPRLAPAALLPVRLPLADEARGVEHSDGPGDRDGGVSATATVGSTLPNSKRFGADQACACKSHDIGGCEFVVPSWTSAKSSRLQDGICCTMPPMFSVTSARRLGVSGCEPPTTPRSSEKAARPHGIRGCVPTSPPKVLGGSLGPRKMDACCPPPAQ